MRIWALLIILAALTGCQASSGGARPGGASGAGGVGGVEQAWLFARVMVPASAVNGSSAMEVAVWADPDHWQEAVRAQLRNPGGKMPAAVFLHGCAGLPGNTVFVEYLARQGIAVFAPNSFGRSGRRAACYAQKGTPVYEYRAEEIAYALARVREISWVDGSRIILVGHSEGGEAAARWSEKGFKALVISGADCSHSGPAGSPLVPTDVPVLAIIGANDRPEWPGCKLWGRDAPSKSVIIPNAGHAVYKTPEGQREITAFLKACCGG